MNVRVSPVSTMAHVWTWPITMHVTVPVDGEGRIAKQVSILIFITLGDVLQYIWINK